ncbi:TetR/AcrR family transcriptional regulator [Enterococcus sp. 2201sp1_2201st1_B8_2201SCRN_220225]|uniref:TetR/AcrR family transcriptional regulator n=1 Tax=unclassified Enterococcus TaxID=2608891 RepID=UPI0034A4294E
MNGFEKRSQQKMQAIKNATFALLNQPEGVEGVRMDKVAKEAGVSKATIFKYFHSKERLIQQVFLDYLDTIAMEATDFLQEDRPFEDKLMALAQVKIKHLEQVDQQFFIDLMNQYSQKADAELAAKMQAYNQRYYEVMATLLQQGRQEGKIDLKYSDEFIMIYLESMVQGVTNPAIYQKINIHYTEYWAEMLLKALAPSPEK